MPAVPVSCYGCHRPVVVGPVYRDAEGHHYGPRCGEARGLAPHRIRVRRPDRTEMDEQPVLDGLDEINDEE